MANIDIGKTRLNIVSCHRLPERSFFWKGRKFPLCARCMGIYVGFLAMPLYVFCSPSWIVGLFLIIPTVFDGMTQAMFGRESTNWLRLTTGVLAGVGLVTFCAVIGNFIGTVIVNLLT